MIIYNVPLCYREVECITPRYYTCIVSDWSYT